jgi:tetratricopeptide (TPR) repeat protein
MRNYLITIVLIIVFAGLLQGVEVSISEEAYQYFQEGEKLANDGLYEEAIEKFKEVLKLEPELVQAREWLAFCYMQIGENSLAITQYEKIVKISPTVDNLVNLGLAYYEVGNYDDAVNTLNKAVKKDPGHFNALNNLGLALKKNGDIDGAVKYLEMAVESEPNSARGHNNLGTAYKDAGEYELAKEHYFKALELDPGLNEVYYNIAIIYKFENNTDKIAEYFVKYLKSGGGSPGKVKEAVNWLRDKGMFAEVPKEFK